MTKKYTNQLFIFADDQHQLQGFMAAAMDIENEEYLSLERLCPSPEGAEVDWCHENWGTCCLFNCSLKHASDTMLYYRFETPCDAPLQWLEKVSQLYPDLCFYIKFKDEKCGEIGGCVVKGDAREVLYYNESLLLSRVEDLTESEFEVMSEEFEILTEDLSSKPWADLQYKCSGN